MIITYTLTYTEKKFKHFSVYDNIGFDTSLVFWEYFNLVKYYSYMDKDSLTETIKNHKQVSKSKLRISYDDNRIEFFKPNKYVFSEFYILFE